MALVVVLLAAPFQAQALEDKLVIVASYPPDTTFILRTALFTTVLVFACAAIVGGGQAEPRQAH